MGFIAVCLLTAVLAGVISAWACDWDWRVGFGWLIGALATLLVVCAFVWSTSYYNYVNARTFYDATREQYIGAMEMYNDYAVIDIDDAAWTDFKYEGYQENMADFIKDLRHRVVRYNETIVSKRIMKESPFLSWMIFAPDEDMKILRMRPGK